MIRGACTMCIFCFIVLLMFTGCKEDTKQYYLKDHWHISSSPYFLLRSEPKKVTEYFYNNVDDINTIDTSHYGSYQQFEYDREGNLWRSMVYYGDSMSSTLTYTYTDTGYTLRSEITGKENLINPLYIRFEAVGNGSFRKIHKPYATAADTMIYRYDDNGDEVITEQSDASADRISTTTVHSYYKGQTILKRVTTTKWNYGPETIKTQLFNYGNDSGIETIVSKEGDKTGRWVFIKNSHADPFRTINIQGTDTVEIQTNSYLYDEKGNWIRNVQYRHQKYSFLEPDTKWLTIRKIEY